MTYDATHLHACQSVSSDLRVIIADGTTLPITSRGLLHTPQFRIPDVAYIPQLSMNLISASQLASHVTLLYLMSLCVMCRIVLQGPSLELVVAIVGYMCSSIFACHTSHHLQSLPPSVYLLFPSASGTIVSVISVAPVSPLLYARVF